MAAIELYSTPLFSDANLQAYYRFEGNGNDSKNSYNLTAVGVGYSSGYGYFGQGPGLNGTGGYLYLASSLGLTNSGVASYSVWFKRADSSSTGVVIGHTINPDSSHARHCWIRIDSDTSIIGEVYTNGYYTNSQTVSSLGTSWHHTVLTLDGSYIRLYLDGSLLGSPTAYTNTPSDTGSTNFTIGRRPDTTSQFFTTAEDDGAVFNKVLTATEISNLYNGTWTKGGMWFAFA
jgi:hypothetical protein